MAGQDQQGPFSIGKLIVTEQLTVGRDLHLTELAAAPTGIVGISPPLPDLFIGRGTDLREARRLLKIGESRPAPGDGRWLLVIRGWPGVGKSSLSAVLAQDEAVRKAFPDGTLWTSLGRAPDVTSAVAAWGRALGQDLTQLGSVEEGSGRLATLLQERRMLLIVDDVWEPADARPFLVGGAGCGHLVTTRIRACAEELAATPEQLFSLPKLDIEASLQILSVTAPAVIARFPDECRNLAEALEGLPLSLRVAGRLLNVEWERRLDLDDLLRRLQEGTSLLAATPPSDLPSWTRGAPSTLAALLQLSVDCLSSTGRRCFAGVGVFAPRPATFDLAAAGAVWGVAEPLAAAQELLDRGLLEPAGKGRFQMHSLLCMYAESLLKEQP